MNDDIGRLLISCPDRPGVVAAVSHFLFDRGANIIHSDQHSTEHGGGTFFMRTEFRLENLIDADLEHAFKPIAGRFGMVKRLGDLGLLGPDTTYIHCCYLSDEEWRLLADSGGDTKDRIPSRLEGYRVVIEVIGTVRPR